MGKEGIRIVFEDNSLLVLDKPSGLVVNRSRTQKGATLQDLLADYFKLDKGDYGIGNRVGIVHRLDKDTSGLLLVAKTPEAFINLQSQFIRRQVEKKYLALTHGIFESYKGQIELPISRSYSDRTKFRVQSEGREAQTYFEVEKCLRIRTEVLVKMGVIRGSNLAQNLRLYSLVSLMPKSGRTHQLRVHLKAIHHPIVGDSLYTGRKIYRYDKIWCGRLFLHAGYLSFIHPQKGERVTFYSELPKELKLILLNLEGFEQ